MPNKYTIDGNVAALIPNGVKYRHLRILIDVEDLDKVLARPWRVNKNWSNNHYAIAHTPMVKKKRKVLRMHSFLLDIDFVDHINGNGLDNRKSNLRKSDHKTNAQNRQNLRKTKTSKYKGVFFWKRSKKWHSGIVVNGKLKRLGLFSTEKEAALCYNKAALKHFGQFAFINQIKD